MFEYYNHLSFIAPYYFRGDNNRLVIGNSFSSIVNSYAPHNKSVDIVGVIEMLSKHHLMGDRCLINGIKKTPWMAKIDADNKNWVFANIPPHGHHTAPDEVIAARLFEALCKEITGYVGDKKNIAILLSGGMDSRITAGTIDHLIKEGILKGVKVTALSWGNPNSRDVVYGKRIADLLGWDWKHYVVDAAQMLNNIDVAAQNGSEYSPMHLHALPLIRNEQFDGIFAASYGDSVGRAEYSGVKVAMLKSLREGYSNFGGILKNEIYSKYKTGWMEDVDVYHRQYPRQLPYQQYELDYQLHYMRRMLNSCMEVAGYRIPLYQVFTHPDVFGYMWALSPEKRTDRIYSLILQYIDKRLNEIPWARTGKRYGSNSDVPDQFDKKHHSYSKIICTEIFGDIKKAVLSDGVKSLGIFNMDAIQSILKSIDNKPAHNFDYIERISWLAAFSKMLQLYPLEYADKQISSGTSFPDIVAGKLLTPLQYNFKYYFRKLRG